MAIEHIGSLSMDMILNFDTNTVLKQLNAMAAQSKFNVEIDNEAAKKQLLEISAKAEELRKVISSLASETRDEVKKLGLEKFVKDYNDFIESFNDTKGKFGGIEKLADQFDQLEISLTKISGLIKGTFSALPKASGETIVGQLGNEANKTSTELDELNKKIDVYQKSIDRLEKAKSQKINLKSFSSKESVEAEFYRTLEKYKEIYSGVSPLQNGKSKQLADEYILLKKLVALETKYYDNYADYEKDSALDKAGEKVGALAKSDQFFKEFDQALAQRKEYLQRLQNQAAKLQPVTPKEEKPIAKSAATEKTINEAQDDQSKEIKNLENLKSKLGEVKQAVLDKTDAFRNEGSTVNTVVDEEIEKLSTLQSKVEEIKNSLAHNSKQPSEDSKQMAPAALSLDLEKLIQELDNYRVQVEQAKPFQIPVLPTINLEEWINSLSQQLAQLNPAAIQVNASAKTIAALLNKDKAEENKLKESIDKKAEAYQHLIETEKRVQELQFKQISGQDLGSREANELNRLTAAREKDLKVISSSSTILSKHVALKDKWKQTQTEVTNALLETVNAQEKEAKIAKAKQSAIDGYKLLAKTEEEYQKLLDKRGGDNAARGKDSNLAVKESDLKNYLNIVQQRSAAESAINVAKQSGIDLSQQEVSYEQQRMQIAEKLARYKAAISERSNTSKVVDAYNTLINTEREYQVLESKRDGNDSKLTATQLSRLVQLNSLRQKAIDITNASTTKTAEGISAEERYKAAVEEVATSIERLSAAEQDRLTNKHGNYLFDANSIDDAKTKIEEFISSTNAKMKGSLDWSQSVNGYVASLQQGNKIIEKTKFHLEQAEDGTYQVYKNVAKTGTATSWWDNTVATLGNRFKALGAYLASFVSVYRLWDEFKSGINIVKDLDTQFTEMRKVSDESVASLKRYQKETFNVAKEVGSTAAVIQSSTADYMRLGLAMDEAGEAAKATAILMNVSEFQSIEEATESLISMRQAYKELSDMEIIDKLNLAGNNFSISTSDLAQSLQQSAAALKVAGNDINEAIALTVGANSILQDPLSASKGVRTISLRLIGTDAAKKELEELGEDISDFEVTTTSKMAELIENLTSVGGQKGFSILDDIGNYKSTYEILLGIAKVWKQIREEDKVTGLNRQEALLEKMAGELIAWICGNTYQRTYLIARTT